MCSCLPTYNGSPPGCRPECVQSSECSSNKACINQKCVDPCPNVCGTNALCRVQNHSPICSCIPNYIGDPFTRCNPPNPPAQNDPLPPTNPCYPSPCGPNSQCRDSFGVPSCSCLPTFFGAPPNCRPECAINQDCASNLACIRSKCVDPCPGSCGLNALCTVINHTPTCTCVEGYVGDSFSQCLQAPPAPRKKHTLFKDWTNNYT